MCRNHFTIHKFTFFCINQKLFFDFQVARRLTEVLAEAENNNGPLEKEDFPMMPTRYGQNVHSPEFIDFPIEIKVNESVPIGSILVKLKARDRDLGYNGELVYGISGKLNGEHP